MSSPESKQFTLKSSDGEVFVVDEAVASLSQTIKNMIEDCADTVIPLPNVSGRTLSKVIEYCKKHVAPPTNDEEEKLLAPTNADEEVKAFDEEFVNVDRTALFDIILAANYMDIKSLLDLTCQAVADDIKHKTVEEVRAFFNIDNDFTPEEEEEVRNENAWAFE